MHGFLRLLLFIFVLVCVNTFPQDGDSSNDLTLDEGTLDGTDTIPNEKDPGLIAWGSNEPDLSNDISDTVNAENPNSDTVNGADGTDTSLMTWLDAQNSANFVTVKPPTTDNGPKPPRRSRRPKPQPVKPRLSRSPPYYCLGGRKQVCCTRSHSSALGWSFQDCNFWSEFLPKCLNSADCCMHIYYPEPNDGVDCNNGFAYPPGYEPKEQGDVDEPKEQGNVDEPKEGENAEDATARTKNPISGGIYATPPKYKAPDDGAPDDGLPPDNRFPGACPANLDKGSC